jgi:hypothetical protein
MALFCEAQGAFGVESERHRLPDGQVGKLAGLGQCDMELGAGGLLADPHG